MRKRTREILALVLLAALLVVGLSAMGYYIIVGHNWNVTASHIDDSIGQMDGYTVFVYEGTQPSPAERERISDAQPMLDDGARGASVEDRESNWGGDPVDIKDVAKSYRDKGAVVFTVSAGEPERYSDPFVVAKAGKRVGFMSAVKPLRKTVARRAVRDLELAKAECIVAVTDDSTLCEPLVRGISIIVCDDDEQGPSPDGEWHDSTYCVGVPYIGEVGAVIMSPSGVLSTKTITEL